MPTRPTAAADQGFTLVEVLVGMLLLAIGMLAVVSMVDGANAVTSKTKAREGASNVARSVIEVARAVPYKDLTTAELLAQLATRPGLADAEPKVGGHQIRSRGIDYTLTVLVCAFDDPKDHLGAHPVSAGFCTDSAAYSGGRLDNNPDDYRRVAVMLAWPGASGLKQTTLLTNPVGGLGPSVSDLQLTSAASGSDPKVVTAGTQVSFRATTSSAAVNLDWSVNGDVIGAATPDASETVWTFAWDLGDVDAPAYYDCTYVVQAEAFDAQARAGAPRAVTVVVNRRRPLQVTGIEGGRGKATGAPVDLEWHASLECDVLGYRVERASSASGPWSAAACMGQSGAYTTETSCVDEDAPVGDPLFYRVVAIDKDGDGALRDGDPSAAFPVAVNAERPTAPTNLSWCVGGQPGCHGPEGQEAPSGKTVISWDESTDPDGIYFYRVYRGGDTYDKRVDVFFPQAGGGLAWIDLDSGESIDTYRLTAVDLLYGESPLSEPIVAPSP